MSKTINLNPKQDKFIFTEARYPCFVGGWGTGKTMCGILKCLADCNAYEANRWLIVRKEFTRLEDSTIPDFERYTGLKVDSHHDCKLDNGSIIMFRHGDQVNNPEVLQNMNLGGVLIEQAEEFDTDKEFQLLRGRIRLDNVPHKICLIANAKGHNWIWKLWKRQDPDRSIEFELVESTSFDNAEHLPADTVEDWKRLEKESPHHYRRFILNSWDDLDVEDKVIPYSAIRESINRHLMSTRFKRIICCDPAEMGQDETVIYALENGKIIDRDIFGQKEPMETAGRCIVLKRKHNAQAIAIDPIGVGSGIASRLQELGHSVIRADGRLSASDKATNFNRRTEMYFAARKAFVEGLVSIPDDDDMLVEELGAIAYEITSSGQRKVHSKDKICKADYLGHSPNRADALVYGLWALDMVDYDDTKRGLDEGWVTDSIQMKRAKSYSSVLL